MGRHTWGEEFRSEEDQPVLPHRPVDDAGELDITPMIDITFLLLIFFLVATSQDSATAVQLPEARNGAGVDVRRAATITIADEGNGQASFYLSDGRMPDALLPAGIENQLQRIENYVLQAKNNGKADVIIKAEKGVLYRQVARVVEAAGRVENMKIELAVYEAE